MEKKRCLTGIRFFVFDLDGVIVNSTEIGFQKISIILSRLNLPNVSKEFLKNHWGKKLEDFYKIICDEVGANDEQKKSFLEMEPEVALELNYKFSRELLETIMNLRLFGYKVGLLTSRTDKSLRQIAAQVGLDLQIFDQIQTTNHFHIHKPNGRVFGPFINWAKARGINPEEMVYIGDTIENDFAATQDCEPKLDFIGVVSGANTREEFLEAGVPLCRIIDFDKLPSFLHHVIKQKVEA